MKTIGLIGGMSWESSAEYYRIVNTEVRRILGGLHSAKAILYSVDFDEIKTLQGCGDWDAATAILIDAAIHVEKAGADCLAICSNTIHLMAQAIQESISIPLLHIADTTAERVKAAGIKKIGLLGTRVTMGKDFYKSRLESLHSLGVIIPTEADREIVHRIIYEELCVGKICDESRVLFKQIATRLYETGAEGCILSAV